MCTACIAKRIKAILPSLINTDRTGFMKDRFIGDNIRLIYDLINHVNEHNSEGLLLSIDFEKAFDTVAWSFIDKILDFFNFKEDIKRWIKLSRTEIKSRVNVNGNVSEWFKIKRGCRQGDPLSPYIFILCAEIQQL